MRARLHNMAVSGPMASRETQDNGRIIKGSPVARKDFFDIFSTTHATYVPSLFLHPPAFPQVKIPGCHMQMKDTAVGLMLINTVQIFI